MQTLGLQLWWVSVPWVDFFCEFDVHYFFTTSIFLNRDSGGINLPSLFPFFGNTELEVLSVVGTIILIGTHLTTVLSVKERILLTSGCAWHHYPNNRMIQLACCS